MAQYTYLSFVGMYPIGLGTYVNALQVYIENEFEILKECIVVYVSKTGQYDGEVKRIACL